MNHPQALRSATEEYSLVLDITSRYALYRSGVAFSCKRQVRQAGAWASVTTYMRQ
jgi:hypothetical protein